MLPLWLIAGAVLALIYTEESESKGKVMPSIKSMAMFAGGVIVVLAIVNRVNALKKIVYG